MFIVITTIGAIAEVLYLPSTENNLEPTLFSEIEI